PLTKVKSHEYRVFHVDAGWLFVLLLIIQIIIVYCSDFKDQLDCPLKLDLIMHAKKQPKLAKKPFSITIEH
ncbi:MAG: hypothetical protein ACXWCG_09745, partial [Flavitalea sp.]